MFQEVGAFHKRKKEKKKKKKKKKKTPRIYIFSKKT